MHGSVFCERTISQKQYKHWFCGQLQILSESFNTFGSWRAAAHSQTCACIQDNITFAVCGNVQKWVVMAAVYLSRFDSFHAADRPLVIFWTQIQNIFIRSLE